MGFKRVQNFIISQVFYIHLHTTKSARLCYSHLNEISNETRHSKSTLSPKPFMLAQNVSIPECKSQLSSIIHGVILSYC